jgi:guanylate cyclase
VVGAIQVTRGTYERIKDQFVCEPKGSVNVKGKGPVEVWHVLDETAVALSPRAAGG